MPICTTLSTREGYEPRGVEKGSRFSFTLRLPAKGADYKEILRRRVDYPRA